MLVEGTNAERLAVLQTILPALRAEDVSSLVEWIDLRDPTNPSLRYDGRLTVYLGAGGRDALPHRHAQKRRFPARRGGRRNALLYERQRLDFQPGLSRMAVFFQICYKNQPQVNIMLLTCG